MARKIIIPIRVDGDEHARWHAWAKSRGKPFGAIIRKYVESQIARDAKKR